MTARAAIALLSLAAACTAYAQDVGKAVYDGGCAACHGTGVLGAPKSGDAAAWKARAAGGMQVLLKNAITGKGAMPPKGGNAALTDAQLLAAIQHMMGAPSSAAAAPAPAAAPAAVALASPSSANTFNRLLRPSQFNRPPAEDLIHDPRNDGTHALQPPLTAFGDLPRSGAGNRVDWVKSLREGRITPRADRIDPKALPPVMDLNIVREVKGSMPDVVYPHKQHTEWLDCSNCHPAIFKPQKGANQISMAGILLGEACGVCHGKVAFPVSECRLCHSKPKATAAAAPAAK